MKLLRIFCLLLSAAINLSLSHAQCAFEWGRQVGAESNTECTGAGIDARGNIYATGNFTDTARFDAATLIAAGNFYNPFIAKYAPGGNLLWARNVEGARLSYGVAVGGDGSACITGYFGDYAIVGSDTLESHGRQDIYIAKYDGDGNPLWGRGLGGDSLDAARAIATDRAGNIYIAGQFAHQIDAKTLQIGSRGGNDILIAKYDANGELLWARSAGGSGDDRGYAIGADDAGNVYVSGMFEVEAIFGADTLRSFEDAFTTFIVRLDSNGGFVWARSPGGFSTSIGRSLAADGRGNVYVAGELEGEAIFGLDTLASHGGRDMFVVRLDTAGEIIWGRNGGGTWHDGAHGVAIDSSGRIFCTGSAADPAFGPLYFEDDSIIATYGSEVFVAGYDSSGRFLCGVTAGGASGDLGQGIASARNGDIYIAGAFTETARFGAITLQGNGPIFGSGFLARVQGLPSDVAEGDGDNSIGLSIHPNPARGTIFLRGISSSRYSCLVIIHDLLGRPVYRHEFPPASIGEDIRCDIGGIGAGIYFVRVETGGGLYRGRIVVE